jgi:hypothetical protein
MLPFIYKENRDNPIFTIFKFILNLGKGLIFSLINTFFVIYSIKDEHIDKSGHMAGLWFMSVDIYTNILIIVSVTLLVTTKFHTWIHFAILIIVSFISYIVFLIIVQKLTIFNSVGTMRVAFKSPIMWLDILLVCGFCGLIEFFYLSFLYIFTPNTVLILKRILAQKGNLDTLTGLPKSIIEKIKIYDSIEEKVEDNNKTISNSEVKIEKVEEPNNEDKMPLSQRSKEGNENSKDFFIKDKKSNENIENLNEKNYIDESSEDDEENFTDGYSEKMSKEKNLCFSKDNYFIEPWIFTNKIISKKTNFED